MATQPDRQQWIRQGRSQIIWFDTAFHADLWPRTTICKDSFV